MLDRVPAPALALAAIGSVQLGAAFARTLFDQLGSSGLLLLRLLIAGSVLLLITRPRLRTWSRQTWAAVAVLGLTIAAMNQVFYLAIERIPLGVAVTIELLGPLLLAIVQTKKVVDLLWAVLALGGVLLLGAGAGSGPLPILGVALAVSAGALWAVYILASARLGALMPGMDGLAVAMTIAAVLILPLGASGASAVLHTPSLLLGATVVAVLQSLICYSFELNALRRMPTRVFGILMSMEPAAATIAGLLVLGQVLRGPQLLAIALVMAASVGVILTSSRATPSTLID